MSEHVLSKQDIELEKLARKVWCSGFAPLLSTKGLKALYVALVVDDPKLIQGASVTPPPLLCVLEWGCEAACALTFCGWQGDGLETVGDVEEFFAHICFEADQRLGEPAACRYFLNWFDDSPRDEMRVKLRTWVADELVSRGVDVTSLLMSNTKFSSLEKYTPVQ